MSNTFRGDLLLALRRRLPVPWPTVVSAAVLMAYADGFWSTSLQGAVGAIERTQAPFAGWLLHSTLMLPMFLVAVLWAFTFARRRLGPAPEPLKQVLVVGILVVAAGTLVGIAQVIASAAYDYTLQSALLQNTGSTHTHSATPATGGLCGATCQAQNLTLQVHVRGAAYASIVLLVTNLVLVVWVAAMRGGRLDTRRAG
ncbi:hypothetical protein [Pseudonocardia sp. T1-2H]|uniref:hypothetical protein n=1 Tax=Pseudonocardia sp. T1-2H TaxID=3128899 RepID=UPI00310123D7